MSPKWIILLLVILLCVVYSASVIFQPLDDREIELLIHEKVNIERENVGLQPLVWDERLAEIARNHSESMVRWNFVSHNRLSGYPDSGSSENIIKSPINIWEVSRGNENTIAQQCVNGWLSSQKHRENLLNPLVQYEGIGAKISGFWIFVTQDIN